MNSVPSIPGVEVGAPWLDGYEHVLTAEALQDTDDTLESAIGQVF